MDDELVDLFFAVDCGRVAFLCDSTGSNCRCSTMVASMWHAGAGPTSNRHAFHRKTLCSQCRHIKTKPGQWWNRHVQFLRTPFGAVETSS